MNVTSIAMRPQAGEAKKIKGDWEEEKDADADKNIHQGIQMVITCWYLLLYM